MDDGQEEQDKPVGPGEARDSGKLFSGKQWFAIALVILGAVTTGVINIGVREYYQPDVRYEEGTWYYSGESAIISLRIKNYGAADAEKIVFTAAFDKIINKASINDPTVECRFDERKAPIDPKLITGRIERLVPKQAVLLYYDVGPILAGTILKEVPFVTNMVYNGGIGRTGEPRLLQYLLLAFAAILMNLGFFVMLLSIRWIWRGELQITRGGHVQIAVPVDERCLRGKPYVGERQTGDS